MDNRRQKGGNEFVWSQVGPLAMEQPVQKGSDPGGTDLRVYVPLPTHLGPQL